MTAGTVRLATTIGLVDAGLLPALADAFEATTGRPLRYQALGTGAALDAARAGRTDAVVAHAPVPERAFVRDGWATGRHPFAANEFVLVGPASDPAGVRGCPDAVAAMARIAAVGAPFLTRGDASGTHVRETDLWVAAGVVPTGPWYAVAVGGRRGNAAIAHEAAERGAYTLVDRATVVVSRPAVEVLVENGAALLNVFSVLPVSGARVPGVDSAAGAAFAAWLLGPEAQALVAGFGRAEHGQGLFIPLAEIPPGAWA